MASSTYSQIRPAPKWRRLHNGNATKPARFGSATIHIASHQRACSRSGKGAPEIFDNEAKPTSKVVWWRLRCVEFSPAAVVQLQRLRPCLRPCLKGITQGALHVVYPEAGFKASFTASGGTTSAFGRDTLGGGHQQAEVNDLLADAPLPSVSRPNADVVPPEATQIAMRGNRFETTSGSGLGSRRFQCDFGAFTWSHLKPATG
ncbi:hypothetical protein Bbelb_099480 [Branchiostoma belcheri]|nr:hypothetical protein Bbelb_099480 [Branchiostoma belcheri]